MEKRLMPLMLLEANEGESVEGITRLQKLIFLAQKEGDGIDEEYQFKPGKYGPYSRPLYDDVDRLVDEDFISESIEPNPFGNEKKVYELEDNGEQLLENPSQFVDNPGELRDSIEKIKEEYNEMGFWELLEYVYENYPKMAENSELNI